MQLLLLLMLHYFQIFSFCPNSDAPRINKAVLVGVSAVFLILMACTLYIFLRCRRERNLRQELKSSGLANFDRGDPDSIDFSLTLDEQADLLPYDRRYEFPREKLKLRKKPLGSGAFGVVYMGLARGILIHEDETTVAVKMIQRMADNTVCSRKFIAIDEFGKLVFYFSIK